MDEESYVEKVLAGDLQAFESIIDKYKNSVYRMVYWLSGREEIAEKFTNDFFVKLYEYLSNYQDNELFSFWLYQELFAYLKELPESGNEDGFASMSLYNHSHHVQMQEEILSLPKEPRVALLLSYLIMEVNEEQKAFLFNNSLKDYNRYLLEAKKMIPQNFVIQSKKTPEACLRVEELIHYQGGKLETLEKIRMDDHLEFCPACRDLLQLVEREEGILQHVLLAPSLNEDFKVRILEQLTPYKYKKPKQRTMSYQFGVIGVLVAVIIGGSIVVPTILPWTKMASNYLIHGSFYNVWAEGTYTAKDNDITVEITGLDVDRLHMVVHYEVSSKELGVEDGAVDRFTVYAKDENGKTHAMEAASAKDNLMENNKNFEDSEEGASFYVRALNEDALPDKFTLIFQFHMLNSRGGDWKVEIPIEYDKAMEEVEVVELNEILVIEDKIEVEILNLEKGKNGSRLNYDVRLKKEEMERIKANLKRTNQKFDQHYFMSYHDVFASVQLVNNEEEYLVPIGYPSSNNVGPLYQIDFSNLYADQDFMEPKGIATADEALFAEIKAIFYYEPGFYSLTIPLEETAKQPLDIDLDGYTLDELSVKRQEGEPTNVVLSGKRTQDYKVRTFHWEFFDENGQRLNVYNTPDFDWYDRQSVDSEFELINVKVDSNESQLMIQATQISNDYIFDPKEHRIPLD